MVFLASSQMPAKRRVLRSPGLSPEQIVVESRLREVLPPLLQREREARGMTQEHLAEKAGVHWTTVGKIERGRLTPSLALLSVLSKALDLTITDLLHLALPETVTPTGAKDEDPTQAFINALPKPERRRLLPLLQALQKWKEGH